MRDLQQPGRSPVYARSSMAATSHPLSSQVAIDVLKDGGNAMDAAIAACAVQGVVEPGSTGIGGDCFVLYAVVGSPEVIAYNGSGRAPKAATLARLREQGVEALTRTSPHSVIVPGAVDAWTQLNADHGTRPLAELLQPAIEMARDGYPVSPRVHADWRKNEEHLRTNDALARIFLPDDKVPAVGSIHYQTELAQTLEQIGREGRDAFYNGALAQEMVDTLQGLGGLHTMEDFATAKGDYVTTITSDFAGETIHECPPNGQGVIALLLMNMMRHAPDMPMLSADRIHLELEACRRAYGARGVHLADPAQVTVPVETLLSENYARALFDDIAMDSVKTIQPATLATEHRDTVTISVVDKDRNAVSFINTLFWGWGSGITTPKSGIVLTNRGEGFVLEEGHPNCIAPGKRPLHTIIPGMLRRDGRTSMSFGVMGGEYQAMGHMQFLTRHLDYGLDVQEAQDAPRWMVDPYTGVVEIEDTVPVEIVEELRQRGHDIAYAANPIGGSQAIRIDWENGVLIGGSDPRKDGCAIGY